MLLAAIPSWAYIVAIIFMEALATVWFFSSIKRGKREGVSIRTERITYIFAVVFGLLGIVAIALFPLLLS